MPTLNSIAPENIAHGSEILLQAQGPTGAYITIGEIYEMQYDADNKMEPVGILGTRRTAYRRGRFEGKGSVKAYWLYGAVRTMWMGSATPSAAASGPILYDSQVPFVRYNIIVVNANWPGNSILNPYLALINCSFEKDTVKWAQDKMTLDDIAFVFEDILGQ